MSTRPIVGQGIAIPPVRLADLVARLGGVIDPPLASGHEDHAGHWGNAGHVGDTGEQVATCATCDASGADGSALISRVITPSEATFEGDLSPVLRPRSIEAAKVSPGVLLVDESLASRVPSGRRWVHPSAVWVMAKVLEGAVLDENEPDERSLAHVEPGAVVAQDARIGAFSVIRAGAVIGPGSVIGPHAIVHARVVIGARVVVGAHAVLGRPGFGWAQGPDGLTRVPQLGGVVIEDDVEVGPACTIDAGTLGPTRIRRGARLDAKVHVGHNVDIGAGTLVAAQSGFAGSCVIGAGVMIGGQAGFADHVTVGDGARIAAKSGVIGDIAPGSTVAGYPAVERWRWLRGMAKALGLPRSSA